VGVGVGWGGVCCVGWWGGFWGGWWGGGGGGGLGGGLVGGGGLGGVGVLVFGGGVMRVLMTFILLHISFRIFPPGALSFLFLYPWADILSRIRLQ